MPSNIAARAGRWSATHRRKAMDFKQMGVGLGVAVLIDATIVRAVLLPATMKLLGDRNWYLLKGLRGIGTPVEPAVGSARA